MGRSKPSAAPSLGKPLKKSFRNLRGLEEVDVSIRSGIGVQSVLPATETSEYTGKCNREKTEPGDGGARL